MQTATSSPPAPIAIIPHEPDWVVWLSAPTSVLPGVGEALAVDVVADAVSGPREPGPVLRRHRLQEAVVVRVLEVDLEDVVVDVDDRRLDLDALVAEELELHHRHRPGGVLGERLVDGDRDLVPGDELPADEVLFENRACEGGHRPQYRKSAPMPFDGIEILGGP